MLPGLTPVCKNSVNAAVGLNQMVHLLRLVSKGFKCLPIFSTSCYMEWTYIPSTDVVFMFDGQSAA